MLIYGFLALGIFCIAAKALYKAEGKVLDQMATDEMAITHEKYNASFSF